MSSRDDQIILIGYRASGKTTVGRKLAERLGRPFMDADEYLEAQAGRTIREIFATEGEPGFRDRESAVLRELTGRGPMVLATGGGVVLREENRDRIRAAGFVAWLTADADTLWDRLQTDPVTRERRPNLAGGGLEEVTKMLTVREPLYRALANLEINVAELSPDVAADRILAAWNARRTAVFSTISTGEGM
ncbi:shikimate kinase [Zavarzinella formosa]|uniref:shikimate kinase n=1 Tax=Zavarzinella formosa TaxID=360055 RepID=UPI0002E4C63D|nr:shikimate kinase [Zavarzinella formosa]